MDKLDAYLQAKERGVQWLLKQIHPDGSIGPVEAGVEYYRVPWAFAVSGRTVEAMRLTDWIGRNMFTPEGDFAGKYPRGASYEGAFYAYPNANLVYGAHMLRRFDISYRGIQWVVDHLFDAHSGGFFTEPQEVGASDESEIWLSMQCSLSFLVAGRLDIAEQTGAWLRRIWEDQPDRENKLYHTFSSSKGLITDLKGKAARTAYVVEREAERQWYFVPGIAAAFLVRLYLATGKSDYLELAKAYQSFAMRCTDKQFDVPQVCKTGWGAALLYLATREKQYQDWMIRVGDYFVETQQENGTWLNVVPYREPQHILEITSEFVVHLDTIIGTLTVGTVH
jgi:hypothetical protein